MILGILASAGGGAATAYESIATANPNGTTVTFSSIPSTYTHLQVRVLGRRNAAVSVSGIYLKFNSDATSSYSFHYLSGDGATATAGGGGSVSFMQLVNANTGDSSAANTFGVSIIDILDYASTTKNKTVRAIDGQDQNGSGNINITSGAWFNTSAINRIDFDVINYTNGTTFALYGIKAA